MRGAELDIPAKAVRLRLMRPEDAADLCRIVTLPEVGRMLFRFPADWTETAAAAAIAGWSCASRRPFRLAIAGRGDRLIGSVGIHDGDEPEIYCFLDPAEAGRGVMTAALSAFVPFAFRTYPVGALTAAVFTDNPGSARILERLGFVRKGTGAAGSPQRLEPAPVWQYRLERLRPRV